MASQGNSLSERISRWHVLVSNLQDGIATVPHVADDLKELQGLLGQARALESEQEDLRSQLRKATTNLRGLGKQGDAVRGRLGASLRGKLGFSDETLIKFGFKPRPTIRRGKSKSAPATQAPTAPESKAVVAAPAAPNAT